MREGLETFLDVNVDCYKIFFYQVPNLVNI